MQPVFFASPAEFRAWLEQHHAQAQELLVGYYKVGSGKPSMTWAQSVDEALCFGWIDGLRKRLDDQRYTIRFTPRKPRSTWSAVNVERVAVLTAEGRMRPAGLKAFQARAPDKTGIYAYEQRKTAKLEPGQVRAFKANQSAWAYFQAQPAWYQTAATWWVVSAKKKETQQRRLAQLIADSAAGRSIPALRWRLGKGK
jgi:uncharacterized protein YdeI (YjbR/CyaY-like superfamily)